MSRSVADVAYAPAGMLDRSKRMMALFRDDPFTYMPMSVPKFVLVAVSDIQVSAVGDSTAVPLCGVAVGVAVDVAVAVCVAVAVNVGVGVGVAVDVAVAVSVAVAVGVGVSSGVSVAVGVTVGVEVGSGAARDQLTVRRG